MTSGHGYVGSKFPIAQSLVLYQNDRWTTKDDIELMTERIADFVFE